MSESLEGSLVVQLTRKIDKAKLKQCYRQDEMLENV